MHDIPSIRCYVYLRPVAASCFESLAQGFSELVADTLHNCTQRCVHLFYEGIYIDHEHLVQILKAHALQKTAGRIDYIDTTAWTLTRTSVVCGLFSTNTVSLNHVLDYAGL